MRSEFRIAIFFSGLSLAGCATVKSVGATVDKTLTSATDVVTKSCKYDDDPAVSLSTLNRDLKEWEGRDGYDHVEGRFSFKVTGDRDVDLVFARSAKLAADAHQIQEALEQHHEKGGHVEDLDAKFIRVMATHAVVQTPQFGTRVGQLQEQLATMDVDVATMSDTTCGFAKAKEHVQIALNLSKESDDVIHDYQQILEDIEDWED